MFRIRAVQLIRAIDGVDRHSVGKVARLRTGGHAATLQVGVGVHLDGGRDVSRVLWAMRDGSVWPGRGVGRAGGRRRLGKGAGNGIRTKVVLRQTCVLTAGRGGYLGHVRLVLGFAVALAGGMGECLATLPLLADAHPRQASYDEPCPNDSTDANANLGTVTEPSSIRASRFHVRLRRSPSSTVPRTTDSRTELIVITAPSTIVTPILRSRAALRNGRHGPRGRRRRLQRPHAVPIAPTLRVVAAAAAAQARRALVLARAGAGARAAARLGRGGTRGHGHGRRAEVAVAAAYVLVEAVGADGAAPRVAVVVDEAVSCVFAASASMADIFA